MFSTLSMFRTLSMFSTHNVLYSINVFFFFFYPQCFLTKMFSTQSKTEIFIFVTSNVSSANASNIAQSKKKSVLRRSSKRLNIHKFLVTKQPKPCPHSQLRNKQDRLCQPSLHRNRLCPHNPPNLHSPPSQLNPLGPQIQLSQR